MTSQYRFYSFVAALYISPLQCGLQTAHAVSRMHADLLIEEEDQASFRQPLAREAYDKWAKDDQTIIICNALNSAGVEAAYERLCDFGKVLGLPTSIFFEDFASLNCAATATAIVVPDCYYDAKPFTRVCKTHGLLKFCRFIWNDKTKDSVEQGFQYTDADGNVTEYKAGSVETEFISFLKSYRLA